MVNKSFIQFSVDWWVCVIYLKPNCGGGNEDNGDLLQKVPCMRCYTHCPSPAAGHRRPTPAPETPGHPWASLRQSLVGSLLLSPGSWCTQAMFEPSERLWWVWGLILNVISPLLPSFWGFSALGRGVFPHSRSKFDHTRGIFLGYECDKQ